VSTGKKEKRKRNSFSGKGKGQGQGVYPEDAGRGARNMCPSVPLVLSVPLFAVRLPIKPPSGQARQGLSSTEKTYPQITPITQIFNPLSNIQNPTSKNAAPQKRPVGAKKSITPAPYYDYTSYLSFLSHRPIGRIRPIRHPPSTIRFPIKPPRRQARQGNMKRETPSPLCCVGGRLLMSGARHSEIASAVLDKAIYSHICAMPNVF